MTEITQRLSTAIADRYRIERHLGQGGMATVFLAHDVKHDRKVALKVLRPELAAVIGAERFLNEIKVTANLQHPHILPLHDSGEADTFLYYVMPYVEGDTLRDKLNREKQLAIGEAIEITRAVAGALDYAHRQGVIHRDIKPENVLIHDGQALVADFGIALAVSAAGGNRLTETGLSVGTPHYMSPEQAMGDRELDARSDVYSLGAMLYEMLAGDPPYTGSTAQAIVAKVITEKAVPVTAHRDTVPRHVASAIQKALAKLPADRYPSASTFAEALVRPGLADTEEHPLPRPQPAPTAPSLFADWRFRGIALLALAGVVAALWGWLRPTPRPGVARFAVALPEAEQITTNHAGTVLAFSPDGRRIVYTGPSQQLFVRELAQFQARPLPGTEGARAPFFSPDGQWIGFHADNKIKKVALSGGPPLTVLEVENNLRGAAWGEDDRIVYSPQTNAGLWAVPAAGGQPVALTQLDTAAAESSHRWPEVLPGGSGVVFQVFHSAPEDATIATLDLKSGAVTRLPLRGIRPQYAATGHLVYGTSDAALIAVPFDAARLRVTGPPVSLLEGIMTTGAVAAEFTLSRSGALAYISGQAPQLALVMVDRRGVEEVVVEKLRQPGAPRFSPRGEHIALEASESGSSDVWLYNLAEKTMSRLTFEGTNRYPAWSPDGSRIAFSSSGRAMRRALFTVLADGSGVAEPLHQGAVEQWETAWLPDGKAVVVREVAPGTGRNIVLVPLGSGAQPQPLVQTSFNERSPALSPDGRWMAYTSNESGRDEVYVRPLPGPGGKRQVSVNGGTEPLWARSGQELFYRAEGKLFAVTVKTTPTLSVGNRVALFDDKFTPNGDHTNYDVSARDGRFVMIKGAQAATNLVIVLNWYEELKERMGK